MTSANIQQGYARPVTLAQVIGRVESQNDQYAIRFEDRVFSKMHKDNTILSAIRRANLCTYDTAVMIYSTSFGEFQLMGFELYGADGAAFGKSVGEYFSETDYQLDSFNKIVHDKYPNLIMSDLLNIATRAEFARWYNGPDNLPDYTAAILESLQHFGVKV